jgi:peptidylprolyl isomerase
VTFARLALLPLVLLALVAAGCDDDEKKDESAAATTAAPAQTTTTAKPAAGGESTDLKKKPTIEKGSGPAPTKLVVEDIVEGSGPGAKAGDQLTMQYVGALYDNGQEFDASWDRGEPFQLQLGQGMVIPGWDEGLVGIKKGGRRKLVIPANLAYGAQGSPPAIPPNATLIFIVDRVA